MEKILKQYGKNKTLGLAYLKSEKLKKFVDFSEVYTIA